MPDAASPDEIVPDDHDRRNGHAPAGVEVTAEERETIEAAPVEEGEAPTRAGLALPPIRILNTPNQSSRKGQTIRGIVIHETEGGYLGAVGWLMRTGGDSSAHLILKEDGSEATQLVPWGGKAWHACNANSHTLGLEIAGFTASPNQQAQIDRAARICAYWCKRFGIPPAHANRAWDGICTHKDLGVWGGGHHDPGGFSMDAFIAKVASEVARGGFRPVWGKD